MNNQNRQQDDIQTTAIAAISAASATPFKTAFKIYMGMALASLLSMGIFLGGLVGTGFFLYWLVK